MTLARTGWRKQSMQEVIEKQAIKRAKKLAQPRVPKSLKNPSKGKLGGNKSKVKTQAKLKKELDTVFSVYIRKKYADADGNVACYTCGKVLPWQQIQNGHFISRSYLATRWHEDNCRPQCVGDNIFGNGKPLDFEYNLKKELGADYIEEMKLERHKILKLDRVWYNERIQFYKNAISAFTI